MTDILREGEGPEATFNTARETLEATQPGQTLAERRPGWPPVVLELYLTPHGRAADAPKLKALLGKAHIYLFENPDARTGQTGEWQELADLDFDEQLVDRQLDLESERRAADLRDRRREDHDDSRGEAPEVRGTFAEAQIRALYGSKVAVGHTDLQPDTVPRDLDLLKRLKAIKKMPVYTRGSFDDATASLAGILRSEAEAQNEREEIKRAKIETELERIFSERPELLDEPEIRIVETLGSYHAGYAEKARADGIQTEAVGQAEPLVHSYETQVEQAMSSGQPVDSDMLAMAYGEMMVRGALLSKIGAATAGENSQDWITYVHHAAGLLKPVQYRMLHDMRRTGRLSNDEFVDFLTKKGLGPLPQSADELHEMVQRQE